MANEFIARNGLIAQSNSTITGSLLTTGNVGVGTSTPVTKLHVERDVAGPLAPETRSAAFIYNTSTDVIYANAVGLYAKVATTNGIAVYGSSTNSNGYGGYFEGKGYFSENVGIGKAASNIKLDVSGSTTITGSLNVTQGITGSLFGTQGLIQSLLVGTGSSLVAPSYGLTPNLSIGMNTGSTGAVLDLRNTSGSSPAGSVLGTIQFSSYATNGYLASPAQIKVTTSEQATTGNNGGGNIAFWTANTGFGDFQFERMRINNLGQVLIGLTSSLNTTSKLIVSGSTTITGSSSLLGDVQITGSLTVAGPTVVTGSLTVSGALLVNGVRPGQTGTIIVTSGTSFTTPADTTTATVYIVELVGGGGGGAGFVTATGAGGGGGGYVYERLTGLTASTTYTCAIGAGGSGGSAAAGGAGTSTTLTIGVTTYTASGGGGGGTGANATGGAGGTGTNGDINTTGQKGQNSVGTASTAVPSFAGGNSPKGWGLGGLGTNTGAGTTATGHGGGGSSAKTTGNLGGSGTPGIIYCQYYN
jgi:hypothetical protein